MSHELRTAQCLLHRWKEKSEEGGIGPFPGKGRLSSEDEELCQLGRKNKRLRMERDMFPALKKSANGYGSAISKWFNKRLREKVTRPPKSSPNVKLLKTIW